MNRHLARDGGAGTFCGCGPAWLTETTDDGPPCEQCWAVARREALDRADRAEAALRQGERENRASAKRAEGEVRRLLGNLREINAIAMRPVPLYCPACGTAAGEEHVPDCEWVQFKRAERRGQAMTALSAGSPVAEDEAAPDRRSAVPVDQIAAMGEYPSRYLLHRGGSQRLCGICTDAVCPPGPRVTSGVGFDEGCYVDELSFQKALSPEEERRLRAYWDNPRCDREAHVRYEKACNDRDLAELHDRRLKSIARPPGWSLWENERKILSLPSGPTEQDKAERPDGPPGSSEEEPGG